MSTTASSDREGPTDANSLDYLNARETLNGWTPLHLACISGKLDVVYLLMEAGSNPAVKDKVRGSPYHEKGTHITRLDDKLWCRQPCRVLGVTRWTSGNCIDLLQCNYRTLPSTKIFPLPLVRWATVLSTAFGVRETGGSWRSGCAMLCSISQIPKIATRREAARRPGERRTGKKLRQHRLFYKIGMGLPKHKRLARPRVPGILHRLCLTSR